MVHWMPADSPMVTKASNHSEVDLGWPVKQKHQKSFHNQWTYDMEKRNLLFVVLFLSGVKYNRAKATHPGDNNR